MSAAPISMWHAIEPRLAGSESEGLERQPARRERRPCGGPPRTLEQRLTAAWDAVAARGVTACPVCQGQMTKAGLTARCERCGSELA